MGEVLYLVDVWESVYMVKECWVRVAEDVWGKLKRGAASVSPCIENVVGGESTNSFNWHSRIRCRQRRSGGRSKCLSRDVPDGVVD